MTESITHTSSSASGALVKNVKSVVGDDAHHVCLSKQFKKFEDLKVSTLMSKLDGTKDADQAVVGTKEDKLIKEVFNYTGREKGHPEETKGGKSWQKLNTHLNVHVTHLLLMVEDLVPIGFPGKHAYILLRFSDGHIDRCDLMPKKQAAHAELRGFLPGVDVPGKVRYNAWINDKRAKNAHLVDIYTFVKAQPSLLSVELMKQRLQEHDYKMFNLESNNCQDFAHTVISSLAKVKDDDNVEFNQNAMKKMEAVGLRRKRTNEHNEHTCWSWMCCCR